MKVWREAAWDAFAEAEPDIRASVQAAADAAVRAALKVLVDQFAAEAALHHRAGNKERAYGWEDAAKTLRAIETHADGTSADGGGGGAYMPASTYTITWVP